MTSRAWAIKEQDLWGDRSREILNFMDKESSPSTLKMPDGTTIAYHAFTKKCGDTAIVIVNGSSESQYKYAEVVWDFYKKGICVFTYDHRGQGNSSRLLDDHQKRHIGHFSDYVSDLEEFDRRIVHSIKFRRIFLLGSSMGGLVASFHAAKPTSSITALILTTPMFSIKTDPWPNFAAHLGAWFLTKTGKGTRYAPKQGPWNPKSDTIEKSRTTSSQHRLEFISDVYERHPETIVGGATNRWVLEALRASNKNLSLAPKITVPILLFQAAKDSYVRNPMQQKFCSKAPNCALRVIPNAKHEILMENDTVRNYAMSEIFHFIETH